MSKTITFAELRHFLKGLKFKDDVFQEKFHRFRHARSGTQFIFRPYADDDPVGPGDLRVVQLHLDWRGLMEADEFDRFLAKAPA